MVHARYVWYYVWYYVTHSMSCLDFCTELSTDTIIYIHSCRARDMTCRTIPHHGSLLATSLSGWCLHHRLPPEMWAMIFGFLVRGDWVDSSHRSRSISGGDSHERNSTPTQVGHVGLCVWAGSGLIISPQTHIHIHNHTHLAEGYPPLAPLRSVQFSSVQFSSTMICVG